MSAQIQNLLESLKKEENPIIDYKHFDGLDTSIDEYQIVLDCAQGKIYGLFSNVKRVYPWAGLAQIEFTKIFVECPARLGIDIQIKRKIFSKRRILFVHSSDLRTKELIQNNQTILSVFEKEPKLVINTTNQINSQNFSYGSKTFLLAKVKTITNQEQLFNLIAVFKELLFILSKFH